MKQFTFIFLLLLAYSCKTQQNAMQTIKIDNVLELNSKKIYTKGEKITISLKNISKNPVTVFRPREKFFYKKLGEEWKKVSIFYCPCDASCPPPPEKIELSSQKRLTITWNQKEDKCGEEKTNGVRKTIETQVAAGIYRVKIDYSVFSERKTYYHEFQIK